MLFWPGKANRFRLESERLILRLPKRRDWRSWHHARTTSYTRLQAFEPLWRVDQHARSNFVRSCNRAVEAFNRNKAVPCLLIEKTPERIRGRTGNRVLGAASLNRLEWGAKRSALLSYWLMSEHHRQGLMFEALKCLIDYAFGELQLNRIEAEVLTGNQASKTLLEKLAFRFEGTSKDLIKIGGVWRDHDRYALTNPANRKSGAEQISKS